MSDLATAVRPAARTRPCNVTSSSSQSANTWLLVLLIIDYWWLLIIGPPRRVPTPGWWWCCITKGCSFWKSKVTLCFSDWWWWLWLWLVKVIVDVGWKKDVNGIFEIKGDWIENVTPLQFLLQWANPSRRDFCPPAPPPPHLPLSPPTPMDFVWLSQSGTQQPDKF